MKAKPKKKKKTAAKATHKPKPRQHPAPPHDALDNALEGTFPASDAISFTEPAPRDEPRKEEPPEHAPGP